MPSINNPSEFLDSIATHMTTAKYEVYEALNSWQRMTTERGTSANDVNIDELNHLLKALINIDKRIGDVGSYAREIQARIEKSTP